MVEVEETFLETQSTKSLIWLRYIDDIFFIWTHGEQELERFLKDLNKVLLIKLVKTAFYF